MIRQEKILLKRRFPKIESKRQAVPLAIDFLGAYFFEKILEDFGFKTH